METQKKRIQWIDIAKGLTIILMLLGHTPGLPAWMRGVIFSFHMPLFMVVNGYFIHRYDVKRTFRNSLKTLVRPYVLVCLIAVLVSILMSPDVDAATANVFSGLNNMVLGFSFTSRRFTQYGSVWQVWFVITLFFARNLYVLIRNLTCKKPVAVQAGALAACFLLGWFLGRYYGYLPWSLDVAMVSVVFVGTGDYLRSHPEVMKNKWLLAGCLVFWAVCIVNKINIELATRDYPFIVVGVAESVAACILVLKLSMILEKSALVTRVLSWYGKNSMIILGIHVIESRFFPWGKLIFEPLHIPVNVLTQFVVHLIVMSLVTLLIDRYNAFSGKQRALHADDNAGTKRLEWPDIAKGIAMISIIIGHLGHDFFCRIAFMYHLPVFFLLAGYFMKTQSDRDMVVSKAKRLLIPYYLTCFAVCTIAAFKAMPDLYVAKETFLEWAEASLYASGINWGDPYPVKGIGAIWYLWALFIAMVIVNHVLGRKNSEWMIPVIAFIGWSSASHSTAWYPLSIQPGMLAALYLYIGYKARQRNYSLQDEKPAVLVCMFFMAVFSMHFHKGFGLVQCYMGNGWLDFIASICASCMVYLYSMHVAKDTWLLKKVLLFFGKYSLVILSAHLIEMNVLPLPKLSDMLCSTLHITGMSTFMVLIIIKLIFVSVCVYIVKKIPVLRQAYGLR